MKVYLTEIYGIEGRKYNMKFKYLVWFYNNSLTKASDGISLHY